MSKRRNSHLLLVLLFFDSKDIYKNIGRHQWAYPLPALYGNMDRLILLLFSYLNID